MSTISAVVIAKNEEEKILECLKSLDWADEIIYFDNGSTDKTVEIVKKTKAKIYHVDGDGFASRKNHAFKKAKGEWIISIDADERVTPELQKEIHSNIKLPVTAIKYSAFAIPRRNIIFRKEFKHGGQWPDYVIRLYCKKDLIKIENELHEQPKFRGQLGHLKNPLIHQKHDNLSSMVEKTNLWSAVEAKLMYDASHPQMNVIRFATAGFREFWLRMVKQKGYKDGTEGVIYSLYQVVSRLISYSKLWELQLQPKRK